MKLKLLSFAGLLALLALGIGAWWFWTPKPAFRPVNFDQLPGWQTAKLQQSLLTFQNSCRTFIRQDPNRVVGTNQLYLQVKDWQPACREALKINPVVEKSARLFFQTWFVPVEFYAKKPEKGLFTGYYMPLVKGSYTKTPEFSVPIYETPTNLIHIDLSLFVPFLKDPHLKNKKIVGRLVGNRLLPYYTRKQIDKGAIAETAHVLLWINSSIDRLFLEIQGSGIIELENGELVYIGYDAQNGAPYTPIAGVLIKKGIMNKDNASMQAIKKYLEAHPKQMDIVMNQNKSFVFFSKSSIHAALGSQGIALTPGYSLAVDTKWIPMGTPLWLNTTRPDSKQPNIRKNMQRLMIAQDTGGAIRGKVRGDIYWGTGDKATLIAGHMRNEGYYWLLLPRHTVSRLNENKVTGANN